jgi:hypothetical protein
MVQTLKLNFILEFSRNSQRAQHIQCVVDPSLHVFKIKLETARLHDFRRYVSASCLFALLNFL